MKAIFHTKQHRVIVEPLEGQSKEQLRKKVAQIMRKRNIKAKIEIHG